MTDFEKLIAIVDDNFAGPFGDKMKTFIATYRTRIELWPASIKYHHTRTGGWLQHTLEVFECALFDSGAIHIRTSTPPAHPADIFLAAFFHDFAKLYTYQEDAGAPTGFSKIEHRWQYMSPEVWTIREASLHGIYLSDDVVNAILMAEGGWAAFARESTHSNRSGGDSLPLAVLIHAADMISAKILGAT